MGLGVVVPLLHDVDTLKVGLRHEHGEVAHRVAEVLQPLQAVEHDDVPLFRGLCRREGDVDLERWRLAADLAADPDHGRDAHVQGRTSLEGSGSVAADAPGFHVVLAPLLVVVAIASLRLLGLFPLLEGHQLVIGFGRRQHAPRSLMRPLLLSGPLGLPLPRSLARCLSVGLDHLHGGRALPSGLALARLGVRFGQVPQDRLRICLDRLGPFLELPAGALKDVQHQLIGCEVLLRQLLIGWGAPHSGALQSRRIHPPRSTPPAAASCGAGASAHLQDWSLL
jgi:hypothetical protein